MPEMAERLWERLEGTLSGKQKSSLDANIYEQILKILDNDKNIQSEMIQRLLELCIQDPKDYVKYHIDTLNIVSAICRKINAGEFTTKPNLLPSLLKLLHMIKTSVYSSTSEQIKLVYFETLISYPDKVYLELEDDYEVLELFDLYCHQRIPIALRVQLFNVLLKYLKVLPPQERLQFVKNGISTWLHKVVPSILSFVTIEDIKIENSIEALEIIADELLHIDYFDNPHWTSILQCFYEPQKYPAIMKNLLIKGSDIWHRLWTVFIKMLKNQITKSGANGSPINSMLPVVETAFKMDVTNRCRAFHCWNALIDNFSTEANKAYINKRIKLLVIPLYSNNAKFEETVIAKLNTWWHLICGYHDKIDNFAEVIIIPFLQFCFGKPESSKISSSVPGLLTEKTREHCVETFVSLFGHDGCDGCVSFPVLKDKILYDACLLYCKKELIHSLNTAVRIVANNPSRLRQPYRCAWKSFTNLIFDLPDDNVKNNIVNELLAMLEKLIQDCNLEILADIILNDLILRLFDEGQMKLLLNTADDQSNALLKVVEIILHPSFDSIYKRNNVAESVKNFKPLMVSILEHTSHTSIIEALFKETSASYKSLVLWTAITSSICENKYDLSPKILSKMLLWPLKHMDLFSDMRICTSLWLKLLDLVSTTLSMLPEQDKIFEVLTDSRNIKVKHYSFLLEASLLLLLHIMTSDKGIKYPLEALLIRETYSQIHDLNNSNQQLLKLIDILLQLLKNLSNNKSINTINITKQVLFTLNIVFLLLLPEFVVPTEVNAEIFINTDPVLKAIEYVLKLEGDEPLKHTLLSGLLKCVQSFCQQNSLKVTTLATLEMLSNSMDTNDPFSNIIKNAIDNLKEESKLTTPSRLNNKKVKKKEPSIVNTVNEDGEEFVVVKSNWKFNPKKLTDNQKEKLLRKREDIPALYQDLSQSQDEFKLKTWKTDSQDTTATTSSKSNDLATNEKVSSVLKYIDVVPKIILENILTQNNEERNSGIGPKIENNNKTPTQIDKQAKSKVALKDRVLHFRNMIEKSNIQNVEVKSSNEDMTVHTKTPEGKSIKIFENVLKSAPSDINAERPSRLKRKPKKFEEMQLLSIKKLRKSLDNTRSQNNDCVEDLNKNQRNSENLKFIETNLDLADISSDNKKKCTALGQCTLDSVSKCDVNGDAHSDNILNIHHENIVRVEKVAKEQQITESNMITKRPIDMNIECTDAEGNLRDQIKDKKQNNNSELEMHGGSSVHNASNKKRGRRKSRIEDELAIDMVEGHPFLKVQSKKRLTRKKVSESPTVTSRRKSSVQKMNKSRTDESNTCKVDKQLKEIDTSLKISMNLETVSNSQESQDGNGSQDIIESSQDSTLSIVSTKSSKTSKRKPIVTLENINYESCKKECIKSSNTDSKIVDDSVINMSISEESNKDETHTKIMKDTIISDCDNKDDSEFPHNKTAVDHIQIDLTENLDTEPMGSSNEIIVIVDDEKAPTVFSSDTYVDMDTQDIADADTQPIDPNFTINMNVTSTPDKDTQHLDAEKIREYGLDSDIASSEVQTQDESTKTFTESILCATNSKPLENTAKLPLEDDAQRKQDFLDNTLEISPIKTLSPLRENKSPTPDTSSDYVVIKLSSPVQSNGEPYEKCDSPEVFTEDKMSPDKRDQSPPREDIQVTAASPRSLSLKKNKPQVRSGGRAAQMLGLCVPATDRLQTILNSEKVVESEETKKGTPLNSSARRNLRILYNSTNENSEVSEESEESKSFLKMNRSLPAADSSPAVPILKRKLADITDESTVSPASKRKRVSFHDPPVSTTICVKKYIEPSAVRSPQNSLTKRQERQFRSQVSVNLKSQKRLDTVFKLDTALTKALESFCEGDVTPNATEDTEMSSLEPTPLVEVLKNSDLNDVDPICKDLVNCKDPIDNIAGDLSSAAMRPLLVKEFNGKIETVGDLAKMSELEVNRLCIRAPKVQVAKKVLMEYAKKVNTVANEMTPMTEAAFSETTVAEPKAVDVEIQTDSLAVSCVEVQTVSQDTLAESTQTEVLSTVDAVIQTDESGNKSTADIAKSLLEKSDYCEHLVDLLNIPSKQSVAKSLPLSAFTDTFIQEISNKYTTEVMDRLLEKHISEAQNGRNDPKLSFIRDYLSERFSSKDLILLCSELLKKLHDKNL